jgi:hypothetical protein
VTAKANNSSSTAYFGLFHAVHTTPKSLFTKLRGSSHPRQGLVVLRKYKTTPTQSECERNQKLTNTSSIVAHLLEANGNSVGTEATTAHIQVVLADDGTVVAASTAADANQHKPRPGIIPPKFASHTIA